jgi:hypothetical protein
MVTKWDGRRERYDRAKVVRTLARLCVPTPLAGEIADQVERQLHDGISTTKIADLVRQELERHSALVAFRQDLRSALARMQGGADFEAFVRLVFASQGYTVHSSRTIQGETGRHEVDGILEQEGHFTLLEIKHHRDPHHRVSFDVINTARTKWTDIQEHRRKAFRQPGFDGFLVVTNARFTENAVQHAEESGIQLVGWNVPSGRGLEQLIEEKQVYPITTIGELVDAERDAITGEGILTLQQLLKDAKPRRLGLPKNRIAQLKKEAQRILRVCPVPPS